jgi:hypothetical protein
MSMSSETHVTLWLLSLEGEWELLGGLQFIQKIYVTLLLSFKVWNCLPSWKDGAYTIPQIQRDHWSVGLQCTNSLKTFFLIILRRHDSAAWFFEHIHIPMGTTRQDCWCLPADWGVLFGIAPCISPCDHLICPCSWTTAGAPPQQPWPVHLWDWGMGQKISTSSNERAPGRDQDPSSRTGTLMDLCPWD